MGATKMHFYTEHQIEMANCFKALGHPARIAIMEKLIDYEEYNCTDLKYFIGLAQSTISRHLKELYIAGLIGFRVEGSNSLYYISRKMIKQVIKYITKINLSIILIPECATVYFKPKVKHNLPYFMRT